MCVFSYEVGLTLNQKVVGYYNIHAMLVVPAIYSVHTWAILLITSFQLLPSNSTAPWLIWKLASREETSRPVLARFLHVFWPMCVMTSLKVSWYQLLVGGQEQWHWSVLFDGHQDTFVQELIIRLLILILLILLNTQHKLQTHTYTHIYTYTHTVTHTQFSTIKWQMSKPVYNWIKQ